MEDISFGKHCEALEGLMPAECGTTVENLIAIGIMGVGGIVSLFVGGFIADWLMGMRDPRMMTVGEHQGGCLLGILCIVGLWLFVCFPLMRLILWLVCGRPFGWN
jgi:hypothetical protein